MSIDVRQMQRRVADGLSMKSRAAYTLLLVASIAMTGLAASLLFAEDGLPVRTRVAFAVLMALGAGWAVFSAWVLARRRVLFAAHRVAASWLAVGASAVVFAGTLLVRSHLPAAATFVGALMLIASLTVLAHSHRHRARLLARRAELLSSRDK